MARSTRAKLSLVKAGDLVQMKLSNRSHKLAPVYSEPRRKTKANENTVWLDNGQRWSLRRCLLHHSSLRSTVVAFNGTIIWTHDVSIIYSWSCQFDGWFRPRFWFWRDSRTIIHTSFAHGTVSTTMNIEQGHSLVQGPRRSAHVPRQQDKI